MHLPFDEPVVISCAAGSTALACCTDLWSRRIPNWLTGPLVVLGLTVQTYTRGWTGLLDAVLGSLFCGLMFFVFYLAGGMGAGDVKLIAAEGCLLGAHRSPALLLGTVIAGGLFAIVLAAKGRHLTQSLRSVASLVAHHHRMGLVPHAQLSLANKDALRLPYALPVAAGVLVAIFVQPQIGWLP